MNWKTALSQLREIVNLKSFIGYRFGNKKDFPSNYENDLEERIQLIKQTISNGELSHLMLDSIKNDLEIITKDIKTIPPSTKHLKLFLDAKNL